MQGALAAGVGFLGYTLGAWTTKSPLQAVRDARVNFRADRTALPSLEGFVEFRGVVHAHSHLSHDSTGTAGELLDAARQAKLDFLVLTDHYTPRIFTEG